MLITLHPLFLAAAVFYVLSGRLELLLCSVAAALLHESAHAAAARHFGYSVKKIELLPYGARLRTEGFPSGKEGALVALAGPAFNFFLALALIALWWIAPVSYNYTAVFCVCNLCLGTFNLLPVLPLDGGTIAVSLAKNRERTVKKMRAAGMAIGVIMLAVCLASAFFRFSLSVGIMGIFLFHGAAFDAKKQRYRSRVECLPFKSRLEKVTEQRRFSVPRQTPLFKLVKLLKPSYVSIFDIIDENGNLLGTLDEAALERAAVSRPPTDKAEDCLKNPSF